MEERFKRRKDKKVNAQPYGARSERALTSKNFSKKKIIEI